MFYKVIRLLFKLLFLPMGLSSSGSKNLPREGAVIVASNHVSNWDPIIVGVIFKRPIHFMGKVELFNNPLLGKLLTKLYAFPVRRGAADRKAIREALELLAEGKVLGIFPEGARNKTGDDMKAQLGVAMLALKAGVPVIPVACVGTDRKPLLGWFRPLELRVGEPLYPPGGKRLRLSSAEMDEFSQEIMNKINELLCS